MVCDKALRSEQQYRTAALLALITIFYNVAEGVVSLWLGASDETISLFGFGLDSFVEVISGIGIWHMIRRLSHGNSEHRDLFEKRALQITGGAFYVLAIGMVITAGISLIEHHAPITTFWGVIVSVVSICAMQVLIHFKVKVGKELKSAAILADAACTRTCLQLSIVLLIASAGYALTGIGHLDAIGSLAIAGLAVREGSEALGKAEGLISSCSCSGACD